MDVIPLQDIEDPTVMNNLQKGITFRFETFAHFDYVRSCSHVNYLHSTNRWFIFSHTKVCLEGSGKEAAAQSGGMCGRRWIEYILGISWDNGSGWNRGRVGGEGTKCLISTVISWSWWPQGRRKEVEWVEITKRKWFLGWKWWQWGGIILWDERLD